MTTSLVYSLVVERQGDDYVVSRMVYSEDDESFSETVVCTLRYQESSLGNWNIWVGDISPGSWKSIGSPAARRHTFAAALTRAHELAMTVLTQGWPVDSVITK